MANKELIMLEDSIENEEEKKVAIVISNSCMLNDNVLTIPLSEALGIIANISIQAGMLI